MNIPFGEYGPGVATWDSSRRLITTVTNFYGGVSVVWCSGWCGGTIRCDGGVWGFRCRVGMALETIEEVEIFVWACVEFLCD